MPALSLVIGQMTCEEVDDSNVDVDVDSNRDYSLDVGETKWELDSVCSRRR